MGRSSTRQTKTRSGSDDKRLSHVVRSLVAILGRKQTAYIASVKDARAIDRWLENATPQKDVEQRIRLAYHIAGMLSEIRQ
jgi:hypothetical protein